MNSEQLTYSKSLPDDIDLSSLAASEKPLGAEEDGLAAAPAAGVVFSAIYYPDFSYLATTTRMGLSYIPNYNLVGSVTDGFQTVTFSSPMEKIPRNGVNNWGVPPYTEDPSIPETLFSGYNTNSMTWTLSRPAKIFGLELMPNAFGTYTYKVDFYSGAVLSGTITRTITVPGPPLGPSYQGARLFAAIVDDAGIDRVVITSQSGNTLGFLVAQIRYQGCVKLCNVIVEGTKENGTSIPVTCCVSVPGFEVVDVSNNIKANILDTCCDIQEDFVCPEIGPIAGVKTASVKIFAELLIPVTLRAGTTGCMPIDIPYTCKESVVFTISNVFVSSEIKNCRVIGISDLTGYDFHVVPVRPGMPHCCVTGYASLSAKAAACVMTNSVEVSRCPGSH